MRFVLCKRFKGFSRSGYAETLGVRIALTSSQRIGELSASTLWSRISSEESTPIQKNSEHHSQMGHMSHSDLNR